MKVEPRDRAAASSAPRAKVAGEDADFHHLEQAAIEQGKVLAAAESKLETEWEILLPILNRVQAHLSQRGTNHERDRRCALPTWQDWLETFLATTGLDVSGRTIQRRLRSFRQPESPESSEVVPQRSASVRTENATLPRMTVGVVRPTAEFIPEDEPGVIKAGDRSGLVNLILSRCGMSVCAVLRGLSLDDKGAILQYVFTRLVQYVCGAHFGEASIQVAVRVSRPEQLNVERGKPMTRTEAGSPGSPRTALLH